MVGRKSVSTSTEASTSSLGELVRKLSEENDSFVSFEAVRKATLESPPLANLLDQQIRNPKECVFICTHFLFLTQAFVCFGIENVHVWSIQTDQTETDNINILMMNAETIRLAAPGTEKEYKFRPLKWMWHRINNLRAHYEMAWLQKVLNNRKAAVKIDATDIGIEFIMHILDCQCITELTVHKFDAKLFDAFNRQTHIRKVTMRYNEAFPYIPAVPEIDLNATQVPGFDINMIQPYLPFFVSKLRITVKSATSNDSLQSFVSLFEVDVKFLEIDVLIHNIEHSCGTDILKNMVETLTNLHDMLIEALEDAPSKERRLFITFPWTLPPFDDFTLHNYVVDTLKKKNIPCDELADDSSPQKYSFCIRMEEHEHCFIQVSFVVPHLLRKPFCSAYY